MQRPTRRRLLRTVTALPAVTLAGCSASFGDSQTATSTPEYERLPRTAVYVADDVGVRLPQNVQRVEAATNADLVLLHGNPAVDAEQAVTWLADGRAVALLGDRAQETWVEWARSETYRDAFGDGGVSEADPAPYLLVAAAVETDVTTHRYSWGDLPSNAEILRALDEALVEIESRTPR